MRKTLILTGILLALWVPTALAGGININWGSGCWSDGTGSRPTATRAA